MGNPTPSTNMDPLCSGTYLMVSNENAVESYIHMGIPKEDAEIMTDPACKNKFEVEVCGNGIKWQEHYPSLSKYNQTYNLKIGEEVTYTSPVPMTITATKKSGRTFTFEFSALGKKSTSTCTFSSDGLTVKGSNDGGLEYTEVFARQGPEMAVVTSDFPGSFTMVSKPAKGSAITTKWMVTAKGMMGSITDGTNSADFSYKRVPDIVGKWRLVTKQGVEAQLEALRVTGPDKAKMADNFIPTLVEGKALTGGRWRWESTPKIHSDFDFAMNEEYSYTWAGETYKEIATYKPDMTGMLLATRGPHGHVIKSDMTFTKNFLVNVFEIEGLANSRATVIFTRA